MERKKKAWISGIFLILTLVVNGLGAVGFINGLSQKEVSDLYPTLITPSPSTFGIWSVIYGLIILTVIMMIIKHDDHYYGKAIDKISSLFWLSSGLNMLWIVLFAYNLIFLSTVVIFALLLTVIFIVKGVGQLQTQRRFLLPVTFGLYSGWLMIATVVNITLWLVKIQWTGFGISPEVWAIIILLISVVLTGVVLLDIKNGIFPLPIAWAYFGIYNNLLSPDGYNNQYSVLPYVALLGSALLIGLAAIQLYKNRYCSMPIKKEY
ncbi:TspO and MBR related proteins [Anaerobranca californiensis DSM 14826]|jgi:hypothetical protein|uniref:TspO and MBR related proteins n=1 Tax=Anaerobranca californiensis DSM 14826 TaxID=1120989 RepID=A0A1M6PB93_9FIRM|nr:TspO/MBR family protein [Anaerobranca californiensis]SHK05239.1 TspO and MBR related proteins [Anaerobranca californiensis DSM 14826]